MDPTCRGFDSDLGECGFPKSSISDLYKAVGFNTPGAASSAADFECPNSQDASKSSPNLPKIDPKAIQKASWNPSWTIVLKRYDLERPTSSQNAPKSGRKTLQSVPNRSQMEPKTLPNQIFEQFLRLFFSGRKFASFFLQFCGRICLFL